MATSLFAVYEVSVVEEPRPVYLFGPDGSVATAYGSRSHRYFVGAAASYAWAVRMAERAEEVADSVEIVPLGEAQLPALAGDLSDDSPF